MAFSDIFNIAGSAMQAQTTRLNTTASNMANANTGASSEADAYKAMKPVFKAIYHQVGLESDMLHRKTAGASVGISDIAESSKPAPARYEPNNPLANDEGYVFYSNVNVVEEMADMMSASRGFQTSVDMLSRVGNMQRSVLQLAQS